MMEVHQFKVKTLEQISFEALKDSLGPENCISLWQFTKAFYIPIILQLKHEVFHFICENFEQVSLCGEFLQLAGQELAEILGQDDLTVTQESTAYQSVLRWINHMPEERQEAIATLLAKVRLGLMDRSYITENVLTNDVVKTSPESLLLVCKTLHVMAQPSLLLSEPGITALFCRRLPNAVLLMVGIRSHAIEAFDYSTDTWNTVHTGPSLEDPIPHFGFVGTVFLGRCLYLVGGDYHRFAMNRVWRFDLVTHAWREMSPMQESRGFMSVTVLKGSIYAMGGCDDDGTSLRTAERYQPHIDQWTFIAPMNEGRRYASCTALNNKIYICGGGKFYRVLNTAECYNPDANQWTLIAPMATPRYGLGVVAYMGHIYAVGGSCNNTSSGDLRSAEAYDPVTNAWHHVPEMVCSHFGFGVAVMNKRIFVVGCGRKKDECFDLTTNTWSRVSSGFNPHFNPARCCVISGLPNMAEYCPPREPVTPGTEF